MHFTETPHLLPWERSSATIQIQAGCTYGKCKYCVIKLRWPGVSRISPMDEIAEDLDELDSHWRKCDRVFLYGPNPFGIPKEQLIERLELIHEKMPYVQSIGGFARIADIKAQSDDDLAKWKEFGVDGLSIGAESADADALRYMRKPQTVADLVEQCARLDDLGMKYTLFYLAGFAGKGKCIVSARKSAEVFNLINPYRINIMTLTAFEGTDLYDEVAAGDFIPADEEEILLDMAEFVNGLTSATSLLDGGHDTNMVKFEGILPRDREGIVNLLKIRAEQTARRPQRNVRRAMMPF